MSLLCCVVLCCVVLCCVVLCCVVLCVVCCVLCCVVLSTVIFDEVLIVNFDTVKYNYILVELSKWCSFRIDRQAVTASSHVVWLFSRSTPVVLRVDHAVSSQVLLLLFFEVEIESSGKIAEFLKYLLFYFRMVKAATRHFTTLLTRNVAKFCSCW